MTDPFEQGYELYRQAPDLLLIEVWRRVPSTWQRADQEAFLMGYIAMRRQRDQRASERATASARADGRLRPDASTHQESHHESELD